MTPPGRTLLIMKPAALAAIVVLAATPCLAASPIEGLWASPTENGQVEIYSCGPAVCGRLLTSDRIKADPATADIQNKNHGLRTRPLKGLQIFSGFAGGPIEWSGGTLYNPDDGGTYHGTMTLVSPTQLKLTGCIFRPLCKSETWTRIH
jgi:uncharacterized protein (DUF2147 family)